MATLTSRKVEMSVYLATAVTTAVSLVVGIMTPPRSGPACSTGCLGYPYIGDPAFVPRDFIWLYPATVTALLVPVLVTILRRRQLTGLGDGASGVLATAFSAMAASVIVIDYGLQLAVVQPSLLRGETEGLSLISQYNPHGVFILLENVGYLLMAFAFLGVVPLLSGPSALERATRRLFLAGGLLTPAALVVLATWYGSQLEYRFELAALSIDWLVLIVAGVLLSVQAARTGQPRPSAAQR